MPAIIPGDSATPENRIIIDPDHCNKDALCINECPFQCLEPDADSLPRFRQGGASDCLVCGHCMAVCPTDALRLNDQTPEQLPPAADPAIGLDAMAQIMKNRRSIRVYRKKPVPRKDMEALLEVVRWAPTAKNSQPVHWLAVDDPELIREMSGLCVEWLRQHGQMAAMTAAWEDGQDMVLRNAPVVVLAHAHADNPAPAADCLIAVSSLELAGAAAGIGSCWAGILMRACQQHAPLQELLKLTEGHTVYAALMMGYPRMTYRRIPDRIPAQIVWR